MPLKLITTSWDDGHELDFKLAEYLNKYNIKGTFYIPKTNAERSVMTEPQIQKLAAGFEVGGHGLHHVRLYSKDKSFLQKEVAGSYQWLSNVLGKPPHCFCFPGGVYHKAAVEAVFNAGYSLARTTALFSTAPFQKQVVTNTTLQAYPHTKLTYVKHLAKRRRLTSLNDWMKNGAATKFTTLAEQYLSRVNEAGGCFHLWGHSWEIEQHGLWNQLDELLKVISNRDDFTYVANNQLINS